MESKAISQEQAQEAPAKRRRKPGVSVVTTTQQLNSVIRRAAIEIGGISLRTRSLPAGDGPAVNANAVSVRARDTAALTAFDNRVRDLQPRYFAGKGLTGERRAGLLARPARQAKNQG
jgi:hypothetical protein